MKKRFFIIAILIAIPTFAYTQTSEQETDTNKHTVSTVTKSVTTSITMPFFNWKSPTVRLFGGMGNTQYDAPNFPGDYNSTNSLNLELGYTKRSNYSEPLWERILSGGFPVAVTITTTTDADGNTVTTKEKTRGGITTKDTIIRKPSPIEKVKFSGLFFNHQGGFWDVQTDDAPDYTPYSAHNKLGKSWAFGLSSLKGANYKACNIALLNGEDIFWTKLDLKHFPEYAYEPNPDLPYPPKPASIEPRIADGIRFGNRYVAEINAFKIANVVSLNVGASRSVVYERLKFGKWCGSMIVKEFADGLLEGFVGEIRKSSPIAYPIAKFLLQGALDFGFSELQRRNSANWPFNAPVGYVYDEFRFGLGFQF